MAACFLLTANVQFELDRRSKVLMVPNTALRWRPSAEQVAPEAREAFERLDGRKGKAEGGSGAFTKTGTVPHQARVAPLCDFRTGTM